MKNSIKIAVHHYVEIKIEEATDLAMGKVKREGWDFITAKDNKIYLVEVWA